MVLVDTCIWSTALRRNDKTSNLKSEVLQLQLLIRQHRAVMIGSILQEVLSGIRHQEQFRKLKNKLDAFELLPVKREDYAFAANISNKCRTQGIQGSHTDFLICSTALKFSIPVFTTDGDFQHFQKHIPLKLFAG